MAGRNTDDRIGGRQVDSGPVAVPAPQVTLEAIAKKRRDRWEQKHDLTYDAELVRASVMRILSDADLVAEVRSKPYLLIEIAFTIVDKRKQTVPFFLNDVQRDFIGQVEKYGTGKPFYVLKGRQEGFTSLITAMQLAAAITQRNFSGFTLADTGDNTRAIFNDKARMVFERLPDELKPTTRFNSVNELFFDRLNSSWRIATATDQVGRSRTLNFVHFSEAAFYDCSLASLQKSIGEAMTSDAFRVYETTANGFNEAKDLWDSGSCVNLFYPWWRTPEYRSTEYEYIDRADGWLSERVKFLVSRGLDREQIAWYCKKYASYLDKNTIRQEYPCTPEEAFVSSGYGIFDREAIQNRLIAVSALPPPRRGLFEFDKRTTPVHDSFGNVVGVEERMENVRFRETADGYILLHAEPDVKRDADGNVTHVCPYTVGGDTAGSGDDWYAAKCVSNLTGETAATLHRQRMSDDEYAEQVLAMAIYYNDAMLAPETNFSLVPIRVIRKYGYTNLYRRERVDRASGASETVFGFQTTPTTKPVIIGELVRKLRERPESESDVDTLKELLTFVKKDNGRMEAVAGAHDDLVMSLAIAHFASGQGMHDWIPAEAPEDNTIERNFYPQEYETQGNSEFMNWEDF